MNRDYHFKSFSSAQTKRFAAAFAHELLKTKHSKLATVLALQGDLGAGKTTFAQGFLKGLGVKEKTASPTFIIMRSFNIPKKSKVESRKPYTLYPIPYTLYPIPYTLLYHIDAYRISEREAGVLGLKKIFRDPKNIVLIEWAENIKKIIPKNATWIRFEHGRNKKERRLHLGSRNV